ncbi:mitochondrial iron ion transporter [Hysterangium stoloniferum]|nr:mitochondrial iron ion transporter [Hysterangium stoloniferum]
MSSAVQTSVVKAQRRAFASKDDNKTVNGNGVGGHDHDHGDHDHHESHKHGLFGGHDHNHAHGTDAEKVFEALKGGGDAGSRITLIGLFANIGLTATKGAAGWYLHSASLMADAGHSLSDLLGDFVTLFCWQLSRRERTNRYPYGFGKFETLGTTTISLLLVGGALGIGFHSYHLLLEALHPAIGSLPPGVVQDILQTAAESTGSVAAHIPNSHSHGQLLDPNAAWFAAVSVIAKEYLYRITKKVADDEGSSVLKANAIHHRSDAWSSLVALVAILGTWAVPGLPLDPLGGLVVSVVIFIQGVGLLKGAFKQLTDAGVSDHTRELLIQQLDPLHDPSSPSLRLPHLVCIRDVRAVHSGALMFVDLTAVLTPETTVNEAFFVQEEIRRRLVNYRKEITEVRVNVVPANELETMKQM